MIPRYARWTDDEVAELRRLFPDHTAREISERTGRGVRSIELKARQLGLRKTSEWIAERARAAMADPSHPARRTQWQTGNAPYNKGKPLAARGRTLETMFQPGHRPHTWMPIDTGRPTSHRPHCARLKFQGTDMPNWVTNKIEAPEHVIRAMLNGEGRVDFNVAAPFPGPHGDWDGIYGDAETAAESVLGVALSNNPLLAMMERSSREFIDIASMREESFRQFVGMLENYRACGYLHSMDFARKVWGTKWNACEPIAEPDEGRCKFSTAWSCPTGALMKVSERFPDDAITVTYADEDLGSNCGTFTLKAGQVVKQDIAPNWSDMTDAEKARWKAFACEVTGRSLEPDEDEQD